MSDGAATSIGMQIDVFPHPFMAGNRKTTLYLPDKSNSCVYFCLFSGIHTVSSVIYAKRDVEGVETVRHIIPEHGVREAAGCVSLVICEHARDPVGGISSQILTQVCMTVQCFSAM